MFKHNLLLVYRSFLRFKSTFLINLFGLSMGLVSALFIFLWINDELNVDKFHQHDALIMQVMGRTTNANGIEVGNAMAPILAETLVAEMPEVEHAVMEARIPGKYTFSVNDKFLREEGIYAGKDYFNIFSYPIIDGNKTEILNGENNVAISDKLALRLFNTTDNVVGKLITLQDKGELMVSGIFSVPASSSYQFDFILPFDLQYQHYPNLKRVWSSAWANAYVKLRNGSDADQFNLKIENLVREKSDQENIALFATRYSDNYLHGRYDNGVQSGGRIEYVRMFSIIAIIILVIACINFMNLSTARATTRSKEIGIKKAIGANRTALIFQYLGESMVMTIMSVMLALVVVSLFLPQFNTLTGKHLALTFNRDIILAILSVTGITGILAGSYPALYLSKFNPIHALKGKISMSFIEVFARKGLIAFQFVLSVTLIAGVLVVSRQMDLIQNQNAGYSRDHIVYFEMEGAVKEHRDAFISEVSKLPGVTHASSSFLTFFGNLNSTPDVSWQGKDQGFNVDMQYRRVNYDMIELLGIEMKEGKTFSRNVTSETPMVVFNETAVKLMGLSDPIGKTVKVFGKDSEIAGVTKDFHFESLHEHVKPMFFQLNPARTNTIMVKVEAGSEEKTIAALQKYYLEVSGIPLEWSFLDEKFQAQYVAENRVSVLSRYFATLAIVISCLGLFGLVMFMAERKTKEIGIRKIMGSGDWGIVYFLSADFTKLIIAAIVIALPLSYVVSEKWLDGFVYRIDLQWWYFVLPGLAALFTAWVTIGLQAMKAARANPLASLRSE